MVGMNSDRSVLHPPRERPFCQVSRIYFEGSGIRDGYRSRRLLVKLRSGNLNLSVGF